jgi:hypothetical protein
MNDNNFLNKNLIDSMDELSKGSILRSMAIFTAIDLCGRILNGNLRESPQEDFKTFCSSKYMPTEYHSVSYLLYKIFRCGVIHSYIPKGAALLSSNPKEKKYHLNFLEKGFLIYVPEFSKDVTNAVRFFYKDIKNSVDLKSNYEKVIQNLDTNGQGIYKLFCKENHIKLKKINIPRDIDTTL